MNKSKISVINNKCYYYYALQLLVHKRSQNTLSITQFTAALYVSVVISKILFRQYI